MRELLVIIPAFNEAVIIPTVVEQLCSSGYDVVVVDDGSNDDTGLCALEAGAILIRHPVNLGQGAALQTGIEFGLRSGYSLLVTFDADGQHDPSDISLMKLKMLETGADVVLGSRFLGQSIGMALSRRLLLKAAVVFTQLTSGLVLTDAHNGLRLLSRKAALRIELKQNRMAHATEIIDQVSSLGLIYVECPVTIRYTEYSKLKGQSGLNSINVILDLLLQRLRK